MTAKKNIPLVALIGLPNSGKSTLLNRLTGQNIAVTADEAHTTRDVNYGEDYWEGYYLRFVDTGGLVPDPADQIQKLTQMKSWAAIAQADVLLWVMDKRQNPDTVTDVFLQKLWKTGKPVILAINKIDSPQQEKDIADYAQFGTDAFINISAANGYNLSELMDIVIEQLQGIGFEPNMETAKIPRFFNENKKEPTSKKKGMLSVKKSGDHYYVVRENTDKGPGLFEAVTIEKSNLNKPASWEFDKLLNISNLVFDLNGVVFLPGTNIASPNIEIVLHELRSQGKKLFYATNNSKEEMKYVSTSPVMKYFEGGLAAFETKYHKPEAGFWKELCHYFDLDIETTLVFDDSHENVESAKQFGMWAEQIDIESYYGEYPKTANKADYTNQNETETENNLESELEYEAKNLENDLTENLEEELGEELEEESEILDENLKEEDALIDPLVYNPYLITLKSIETGQKKRVNQPIKVLLLGKPNVGKSSLFNKLVGEDVQIVTDIAGTTLSVNDMLVKKYKTGQEYILLDSAGIRKKGSRASGAETFASYRTIQAAYEADVICLVLDSSKDISHQDQVVAGIAQESHKGLVILANKSDLLDADLQARFLKEINFKMKFLKAEDFLWVSVITSQNIQQIWPKIDEVSAKRELTVTREELRKLFNYLMKQKPPSKLPTKKRAVIYDLIFTQQQPPTFELLVKDKSCIHWSYVRFLENIIRRQFNLSQSGLVVRLVEVNRRKVLE